jgi:5-methylthioadenosine/S-adenosylhomocysteine deaminase
MSVSVTTRRKCNNSRDLFEVMKFASLVHRAKRVDPGLLQARDVVRMATRNGAKALRHETGELAAGRKADVVLVDLGNQFFTPLEPGNAEQLFSHLVFAANGSCVNTTIVDGVVVLDDRTFTTIDEDEVLAKANESFLRVLDRIRT